MRRISVIIGVALALCLPANGYAQGSWEQRDGGWYYVQEDGTVPRGWIEESGKSYYLLEGGRCLVDNMTPDNYYVNSDGAWYRRSASVMDIVFAAPDRFLKPLPGQEGWLGRDGLDELRDVIAKAFGQERTIAVTDSSIEYRSVKDKKVLIGLYKEPDREGYRLDLGIRLNRDSSGEKQAATYDYAVFKALLYQFSSSPDILEQAVYSGWQGKNEWQINRQSFVAAGDSRILYATGDGLGRFWIEGRTAEAATGE